MLIAGELCRVSGKLVGGPPGRPKCGVFTSQDLGDRSLIGILTADDVAVVLENAPYFDRFHQIQRAKVASRLGVGYVSIVWLERVQET